MPETGEESPRVFELSLPAETAALPEVAAALEELSVVLADEGLAVAESEVEGFSFGGSPTRIDRVTINPGSKIPGSDPLEYICIGKYFAEMEAMLTMSYFVRRFRWRVRDGYVMRYAPPLNHPRDGLPVKIEAR